MKNILIIGSTGQIGSELTMMLRNLYSGNIVAGYIPGAEPKGELKESGPSAIVDITNQQQIADAVEKYHVDTIYNLAALLSAVAEAATGMEDRGGRTVQCARSGEREEVCRIHTEFHRLVRTVHTERQDSAGHHTRPEDNVRGDKGDRRTAE